MFNSELQPTMTFGWSKLCSSWEGGCQSMEKAKMSSQRPPARTRTRTGFTRNYCRKFYKDLEEMISILVAAPFREQNPQYIWQIFVGYPANILWLVKQSLAFISSTKSRWLIWSLSNYFVFHIPINIEFNQRIYIYGCRISLLYKTLPNQISFSQKGFSFCFC